MLILSSAELNTWVASLLWPLTRILALLAASPIFGNARIPPTVSVPFGLIMAILIAPTVPALPAADPMSYAGLLILVREMIIGAGMGFAIRIVFAAVEMSGEISSLTMGLGFASFFDPMSQGRSSAISQFLVWIATMLLLAVNGHLVLLEAMAESFVSLPVGAIAFHNDGFWDVALWGARIFSAGLQLALPVVAALLIANVALGILTRAAPQLNLFGIGFPITLTVGFLVLMMTMPYLNMPLQRLLNEGVEQARKLPRHWNSHTAPAPHAPQMKLNSDKPVKDL